MCQLSGPVFACVFLFIFGSGIAVFLWDSVVYRRGSESLLVSMSDAPELLIRPPYHGHATIPACHHFNCFDVYRCRTHHHRLRVHVPDPVDFFDEHNQSIAPLTQELVDILAAIEASAYYTEDPEEACLFIPALDLLNENEVNVPACGAALATGPHWHGGRNNLLLTMLPGTEPHFSPALGVPHGRAMVAGAGLSTWNYRRGFDIALPTYSPFVQGSDQRLVRRNHQRPWLLAVTQINLVASTRVILRELAEDYADSLVVLTKCPREAPNLDSRCRADGTLFVYPMIMGQARFCLVLRGVRLTQSTLMDALHFGCIPVIAIDSLVLPFSEVLDWQRFSVRIFERDLPNVMDILGQVSHQRVLELHAQGQWIYERHFESLGLITTTTLDILNDRLFSHPKKTYFEWNVPLDYYLTHSNPLSLTNTPPASDGFTAVILTYDRIESLFAVMSQVAEAPSLAQILVVWNNQDLAPPAAHEWPKLAKPFQVIRTSKNLLSNRFHPYDEITTECILSIDDDIVMLTGDELEFGYQVWREFPDRIVGFPSRTHIWNNATARWKYESEWTSQISMVLTGAAFYHKYWNYLYTAAPSEESQAIKKWVDESMNCEDIAMNFLVANITGKAPIKVTPRKKFKCSTPKCTNVDMLSGIQNHMIERSDCINMFTQLYGYMPLKTVEFRADPVLYKENVPAKLKEFNDIGSL